MSNNAQNAPIVWIDCEMTGLDIQRDALVEVAVVVTDAQLHPLDTGLDVVIKPTPAGLASMNDFVRDMHTATGLINEWDDGLTMAQAERTVLEYVQRLVPEAGKAQLGGNSVGTDKMFLLRDMPKLIQHLHYRIIDVSTIKELAKRWFPRVYFAAPEKTGNHRAIGDIYDSIDELRYYRAALFPNGEGPDSATAREIAAAVSADRTIDQAQQAHAQRQE